MHLRNNMRGAIFASRRQGAILPLLVICIGVIIGLLALVIDGSILVTARSDLQAKVDRLALTGIAQYAGEYRAFNESRNMGQFSGCVQCSDYTCETECAAYSAAERARRLAERNISLGEKLSRRANDRLDTVQIAQTDADLDQLDKEGTLEVGVYYWFLPDGCPGNSNCPPTVPYFERRTISDSEINAVRLRMRFHSISVGGGTTDNFISSQFARIFGYDRFNLTVTSTAALLPRNDFFLIDLSRSMYRDSYIADDFVDSLGNVVLGSAADFAVKVKDGFPCINNQPVTSVCCSTHDQVGCDADPGCIVKGGYLPPEDRARDDSYIEAASGYNWDHERFYYLYGSATLAGANLNAVPASMRHYSADYKCVNADLDANGINETYLADNARKSSVNRPEPLYSVMEAANKGFDLLRLRAMSIDRVGALAFDSLPIDMYGSSKRVLPPTVPSRSVTRFSDWMRATDTNSPFLFMLPSGLFPGPGTFSDIFQPLRLAAWQISLQSTYKMAKNSIVLFTDGLQNCPYSYVGGNPTDWWEWFQPAGACVNNGTTVLDGIGLLGDNRFVDELVRRHISVSVVLFGSDIMPHYVLYQNAGSNGCRDQSEDDAQGAPQDSFVHSNWTYYSDLRNNNPNALITEFRNRSPATPFFASNKLYDTLVAPTHGLWVPLMPPLTATYNGTALNVPFYNQMHSYCDQLPDHTSGPLANVALNNIPNPHSGQPAIMAQITDAQGRLRYDPQGRNPADQLIDAMNVIIQSPYVLVP